MRFRPTTSWVLAFDSSCCDCAKIAQEVQRHGADRLDVMPLNHPDVTAWRRQAFGNDPPFAPTLIRIRDGHVRAWSGPATGLRLTALLGPAAAWRLAMALARLRQRAGEHERVAHADADHSRRLGRKEFLRLGGMGMVAAILVGRAAPAQAATNRPVPPELLAARAWVGSNRHRLPQTYADFITHDSVRRQAIWAELAPRVRSQLWVEQLTGLRATRRGETPQQRAALDAGLKLAGDVSIFDGGPMTTELHQRLEDVRVSAIAAFGLEQARAMFATLGPAGSAIEICECSCRSDWCSSGCVCCASCGQCCACLTLACGTLHLYECRGECL